MYARGKLIEQCTFCGQYSVDEFYHVGGVAVEISRTQCIGQVAHLSVRLVAYGHHRTNCPRAFPSRGEKSISRMISLILTPTERQLRRRTAHCRSASLGCDLVLLHRERFALQHLLTFSVRIGIGDLLPGGNSAHNTIIITKSRYSHQKITNSKKGGDGVYS